MDERGELLVATRAPLVPDEPTLKASHADLGFLSWHASTVAFGPDTLVVRSDNELQVWRRA